MLWSPTGWLRALIVVCVFSLVVFTLLELALQSYLARDAQHRQQSLNSMASRYAQSLQLRLTDALAALNTLESILVMEDYNPKQFDDWGRAILQSNRRISAVQLAPDGIVRHIVPREGNEKALGHDLLADSRRVAGAKKAIAHNAITIVGPVRLIQNNQMTVIARKPVFRAKGDYQDFWGFVIVLIELDALLDKQPTLTNNPDLIWRLLGEDPDSNEGTHRPLIAESAPAPANVHWPLTYDIVVPNGNWQLQLADTSGSNLGLIHHQILPAFFTLLFAALLYRHIKQQNDWSNRLRHERCFALFSNVLVSKDANAIELGLRHLLEAAHCSRVYLFRNVLDADKRLVSRQTHEVCAEGTCAQLGKPALQQLVYAKDGFARWQRELSADQIINGIVARFPKSERAVLESQQIRSILVVPIWVGKEWAGFIGFDETRQSKLWSAEDLNLLRAASQELGLYLDRKQTEAALKASEEEFRIAFEHANDGLCIVDLKGKITRVNDRMCDLFGYSRRELLAMAVSDLAVAEDKSVSARFIERCMTGKVSNSVFEKRYICKDGRTIWGRVSSALVRDAQGEPLHFISHVQDITPVKELVDALTTSESRYRLLADHAADPIWTMDEHQNYTFVSPAFERLYGYTLEELGKGLPEKLIPAHSRQVIMGYVKKRRASIRAGKPDRSTYRIEVEKQTKDGRRLWVESTTTPVFDEQDRYRGVVGVSRDVTDRKRAEEALKASEENMRRLATVDDLTKLANRRYFLELVRHELERTRRYSHSFSLVLFDVDHFKHINDTHGQLALEHCPGRSDRSACRSGPRAH